MNVPDSDGGRFVPSVPIGAGGVHAHRAGLTERNAPETNA
ncbi:hypothetical protein RSPO_m00481 (plasmid) [Ralstonia solanacearum Po82]|uniref:Uncharacterized protein n=1 Tax=Ralstonia solanacearum (strain Po82) TaxID=1031711 RepID=F6G9N5_RALS8|nr:hypothetical protein RSPO_m00481 [Ralstonia solanacearum Po82]